MKYKYTIIWSNRHTDNELISWIGATFDTNEQANEVAIAVAHDLWDTMPSLSWMVLKHLYDWKTSYGKIEEPF